MKTLAKQFILQAVNAFGLNHYARWKMRRKLLILCYHAVVSDDSPLDDRRTNIAVTVSQFEQQLQHLRKHWNPVSLQDVRNYVASNGKEVLPDNAVFVSFDDGYRNNLTLAAPLLKKYNIPAVVFVTTGFIGTENKIFSALESQNLLMNSTLTQVKVNDETFDLPEDLSERSSICEQVASRVKALPLDEHHQWLDRLRYDVGSMEISQTTEEYIHELQDFLTWDEVRELQKYNVDIGCHTVSHPILADLPSEALREELQSSKAAIEQELGGECDTLAYPFGAPVDYSERVMNRAKEFGFRLAFTLTNKRNDLPLDGTCSLNPFAIHRICVTRDLTLYSFKAIMSGIRGF